MGLEECRGNQQADISRDSHYETNVPEKSPNFEKTPGSQE